MKAKYRKRLEKAASILRELVEELEDDSPKDYDRFGEQIEELAGEIEDLVIESEDDEDGEDD